MYVVFVLVAVGVCVVAVLVGYIVGTTLQEKRLKHQKKPNGKTVLVFFAEIILV